MLGDLVYVKNEGRRDTVSYENTLSNRNVASSSARITTISGRTMWTDGRELPRWPSHIVVKSGKTENCNMMETFGGNCMMEKKLD